ncbi:MAG: type I-C CRISPR-associated protein Cas5c [Rhodoferax sp.]|uniref:type I-C CRISPR-associated protein Cas5c n=1 Tax=Rhodoferax sp. TaxID=50421 RepID=UPI00262F7127|nr:type I-C CRISPR-associated protein Cas5c [Rhodoferax sp.]MDD2882314.1 type I-C CRISPR-associated protein Cas5c [Rhodoferax sp.]
MTHFCLEVSGPFACFTRPEMKVERVSYDVMTPSAARSIFEAILWKPAIRWRVHRIEVLKPIRWINLRRNEVKSKVQLPTVEQAMKSGSGQIGFYIEEERVQRAGYFLRDVAYRIHADLSLAPGCNEPLMKYTEMFARRATKGQCVNQPYLGCREFAAAFSLVTPDAPAAMPIGDTRELGWMLHDLDFTHLADPQPRFFNAKMVAGVIEVPPFEEARG